MFGNLVTSNSVRTIFYHSHYLITNDSYQNRMETFLPWCVNSLGALVSDENSIGCAVDVEVEVEVTALPRGMSRR